MKKIFKKLTKKTILAILAIIIIGAPLLYLTVLNQKEARAWFDENWLYRAAVPITAHTNAEANVYITVTVDTATPITAGKMQSDCGDLRFIKANGEALPYYINGSPGCNNAATTIQVNFDDFPAGAQTIYYYYGNPSAPNGFSSAAFSTEATGATVGTLGSETQGPGPVGYWKFDDGQGQTAQDYSSSGNDGTLGANSGSSTDDPSWQPEDRCVSGKCLYFDGGDYADMGDPSNGSLDFGASTSLTVSAWVRMTGSPTDWATIISKETGSSTNGFVIRKPSTGGNFQFMVNDGTDEAGATASNDYRDSKWHHVVGVLNRTTNQISIYVDGVLKNQNSTSVSSIGTLANAKNLQVGAAEGGLKFTGFIDEPKVYNYARTAAQIKTDYQSGAKNASTNSGTSAVLGSQTQDYLSNGLVGYWKMDEASWSGAAGEVLDASGNSHNGVAVSDATTSIGKFGNGGTFDTTDAVQVTRTTALEPTTAITLAGWINVNNFTKNSHIIAKQYDGTAGVCGGGGNGSYGLFMTPTQKASFALYNGSSAGQITSTATYSTGTWYHVAATYSGSTMTLYVNGAQVATGSFTGPIAYNTGSGYDVELGKYCRGDATSFGTNGKTDDTRIYNRALSAKEISDLYNWAPGPVGYWDFEENSGTTTKDKSTNANTGTISGATWKPGKYGSGLTFDGSNDYLDAGTGSSLRGFENHITVEAWVKMDSASSGFDVIAGRTVTLGADPTEYPLLIGLNGQKPTARIYYGTVYEAAWSTALTPNTWYHIAGTYDQSLSSNNIKLYVNGVLKAQTTLTQSIQTNTRNFIIGDRTATPDYPFAGSIDEVKVYSYPRTAKQIVEDMNGGHPAVGSPVGSAVGHWKFDEGQGQTANNSGSDGSALNGTLGANSGSSTDDPSWSQSGKFGKALSFDGGDYVNVADNDALDVGTGDFSVSAWVKSSTVGWAEIVDKRSASPGWDLNIGDSGRISLELNDGTYAVYSGNIVITDGNWHYVAVTADRDGNATVYIDGKLDKATNMSARSATLSNAGALRIGRGGDGFVNGLIDDVKIYSYTLTADEIKLDYNRGSSLVLGTAGNNASYEKGAANQEYCIPGDSTSCAAPVGRWDFEEGNGTTINDTSGNGNTGTLGGDGSGTDLPLWKAGKIGKALQFDGSDDYVDAGSGSTLDMTGAMTIEFWMKRPSSSANRIVDSSDGGWTKGWLVGMDGGYRIFYITAQAGAYQQSFAKASALSLNVWQHVAVVRSGTTATFYVNGVNQTETSATHIDPIAASSTNARIGTGIDGNPFNGSLDGVRVFNYARSAAQIAWDYNRGAPVGHWKLDECQGNTAYDSSGKGNRGTIIIGATDEATLGTCSTSSTAWGDGATGKRNASLSLDGDDDYICDDPNGDGTCNDSNNFDFTGPFSMGLWIKPGGGQDIQALITKGTSYNLWRFNGAYTFTGYGATIGNYSGTRTVSFADTETGVWKFIMVTFDGSTLKIYKDGVLKNSASASNPGTNSNPLQVGMDEYDAGGAGNSRYFTGQVDDVRIYNYALTAQQVKDAMNQGAVFFGPATGSP